MLKLLFERARMREYATIGWVTPSMPAMARVGAEG